MSLILLCGASTSEKRRNSDNCHALRMYVENGRHARRATRVYNFSLLPIWSLLFSFYAGMAFQDCICSTQMRPSRAHQSVAETHLAHMHLPRFCNLDHYPWYSGSYWHCTLAFSEILGISLLPCHYAKLPQIELESWHPLSPATAVNIF